MPYALIETSSRSDSLISWTIYHCKIISGQGLMEKEVLTFGFC